MKALEWLIYLRDEKYCIPQSKDKGPPSNGELRRWIKEGAVLYNDAPLTLETTIEWPIKSLVFFPNGKRYTTIWRDGT